MNNMKRMVWIAVAMLVMIGIMGFGLHSLNRITEVNKERRQKDKGEAFVAKILETTTTTSVWDKLRAKQEANETTFLEESTDENGNAIVSTEAVPENEDSPIEAVPDGEEVPIYVVPEREEVATVAIPIEP